MSAFYDSMKSIAGSLLSQFGQTITLVRKEQGQFHPQNGLTENEYEQEYACKAIVYPYRSRRIDGNLIKAGDLEVTISGTSLSIIPDQSSDSLLIGGSTFRIVSVERISPDGTNLMYVVQARSGK